MEKVSNENESPRTAVELLKMKMMIIEAYCIVKMSNEN